MFLQNRGPVLVLNVFFLGGGVGATQDLTACSARIKALDAELEAARKAAEVNPSDSSHSCHFARCISVVLVRALDRILVPAYGVLSHCHRCFRQHVHMA